MGKEVIGSSGFTAEEEASLEIEPGDDVIETPDAPVEVEDEDDEPIAPAAGAKPNGAKPPEGYAPVQALHEARAKAKEAVAAEKARADKLEQTFQDFLKRSTLSPTQTAKQEPPKVTIPDFETDPVGHLKAAQAALDEKLAKYDSEQKERSQREEADARTQTNLQKYANAVSAFKKENADYDAAMQFLMDVRDKELEVAGYTDPTDRSNRLQYEEGLIAGKALNEGQSPASRFYELAKHRGFKGAGASAETSKLDNLVKGAKASKTLATASAAPTGDEMSLERLAELMDSDPEAGDKLWAKMQRAGRLG